MPKPLEAPGYAQQSCVAVLGALAPSRRSPGASLPRTSRREVWGDLRCRTGQNRMTHEAKREAAVPQVRRSNPVDPCMRVTAVTGRGHKNSRGLEQSNHQTNEVVRRPSGFAATKLTIRVHTPRLPMTVGIVPGEFCWPMQAASMSRSVRCDVQEQHSLSTSGFVAFCSWALANDELLQ